MTNQLTNMVIHATIDGQPDPLTLDVRHSDLTRWDYAAAEKGWPSVEQAPFLFTSFLTWAVCKRRGITTAAFEQFVDRIISARATEVPVNPTQSAVEPPSTATSPWSHPAPSPLSGLESPTSP